MTTDSSVPVQPATGTGTAPIDVVDVTTTDGPVKRQRIALGDGTTGDQTLAIGADGNLSANQGAAGAAPWPVTVDNLPATQTVDGTVELGAGTASIGHVDVDALPPLPAGTNEIGTVGIAGTVGVSGTVTADPPVSASLLTGQVKIATANTAEQFTAASTPLTQGILVQALGANVGKVYVGDIGVTSSTGWELQPGQPVEWPVNNVDLLYVVGANVSDGVCWSGI